MQVNNNGINSNSSTNTSASSKKAPEAANKEGLGSQSAAPSKDSVELSREAQALKRLESQILSSPDVDFGRVASIRQAISEGSYQIDAEAIALKMLDSDMG